MAGSRTHNRRRASLTIAAAVAAGAIGLAVALPANAASSAPEGTIVGASSADAIDGSYIVTLKQGQMKAGSADGKSLMGKYDGKVTQTYKAALNGYAAELDASDAKKLAADPAVDQVFANQKVSINGTQANPPSWGLDRIDQAELPLDDSYTYPDSAGAGATVYVIDTGVHISHEDFGGRAVHGYDAVDDDDDASDGNGHGTHVASTAAGSAYGVAKEADIVGVRVLDDNGSGTTAGVVAGVDWVTQNADGPSVANMSLGGGADAALDQAVENSIAAGVSYAVAAGNSSADAANFSPARVDTAITVGATEQTDSRATYSNYGSAVNIFAPGSGITAAWHTGDTDTNTISGTSMASPHVAGVAALYLADNPDAAPADVSAALEGAATEGVVGNPGSGSPNLLLRVVQ
ncbi:S8 family peptidase [Streptomyces sp. XM4193]|uniref:S8 family peptidase n=1 Tax=Streptomyces sp. XM4193 TaxID=2929782 RepID=UPI0035ABB5BD